MPNEKGQLTRIEQLPKYVAWNPSVELFVTFDDKPAVHNGLLDLKLTRHVLTHRSARSCMSALLSKNAPDIAVTFLHFLGHWNRAVCLEVGPSYVAANEHTVHCGCCNDQFSTWRAISHHLERSGITHVPPYTAAGATCIAPPAVAASSTTATDDFMQSGNFIKIDCDLFNIISDPNFPHSMTPPLIC